MLKALVFDLDETLIRSREAILGFFRELYTAVGEPFPETNKEFFYTAPEYGILEKLFADPATLARATAFKRAYNPEAYIASITLKPFVRETLSALAPMPMAVATNRGASTTRILERLGIAAYFKVVVCGRTLPVGKPHPDVMTYILREFGVHAEEVLFVGDSSVDVQTAESVGAPVAIVGPHPAGERATYRLETMAQLPALVARLRA